MARSELRLVFYIYDFMSATEKVIITITILVFSIILLVIIDGLASRHQDIKGIVIDKHYESERSSSGVGVGAKGEAVVITQHESEKFILIVKAGDKIHTVKTTSENYYKYSIGDQVKYKQWKGLITKTIWSYSL
jgi:hypothetical protein